MPDLATVRAPHVCVAQHASGDTAPPTAPPGRARRLDLHQHGIDQLQPTAAGALARVWHGVRRPGGAGGGADEATVRRLAVGALAAPGAFPSADGQGGSGGVSGAGQRVWRRAVIVAGVRIAVAAFPAEPGGAAEPSGADVPGVGGSPEPRASVARPLVLVLRMPPPPMPPAALITAMIAPLLSQ